jgi:predicted RNase H-like HicB family nuclease
MALHRRDRQSPSFQARGEAGQSDDPASLPRLASEDGEIQLSAGWIEGTAVATMSGYIALVHKDDGTSYGVSFPDVPGCISAGDTFEEAVENAAEALTGHFAAMRADGDAIPVPRSFADLKRDAGFIEDSADAIVTIVTPRGAMAAAE